MAGFQLPKIQQLIQDVEDAAKGAENYATGAVNTVGKTVGQLPVINGMPNSPKIADVTNTLAMGQQTPANTLAQGKATPGDLTSDALILAGAPEAKAEDIGNGTTFTRMGGAKPGTAGPPGYLKAKPATPESAQPKYATGTKTAPLTQNAEKFSNEPQLPPINNQTGWQEFSDQQKNYVPNPQQKAIRQISPKDFIHDNDPVGTTNAVHETLDRMGINNPSAEEQLSVLPAKRQQLYKEAQDKIAADPDNAPVKTIKDNINAELSTQTRLKDISKPAAQKALWDYTQNLYTQATGGKLNGQSIPYSTLFDMKTLANRDYAAVQKKLTNGQPLNDTDKVNAAYRNGLDKTISARYPGVKQDTMDMSNLYKAQVPLTKAIPKYEQPPAQISNWEKIKDVGQGLLGTGVLLGGAHQMGFNPPDLVGLGLEGVKKTSDFLTHMIPGNSQGNNGQESANGIGNQNDTNNQFGHGSSIPRPIGNVNSIPSVLSDLQNGKDSYAIESPDAIKGTDGQSIGLSYNAWQNARQPLVTKYSQQKINDPNGAAITEGQINNLDSKYNSTQNQQLQKDFQTSQTAENAMKTAVTQLKTVAPDMSQAFGSGNFSWDAIRNSTDPKYNALKQSLNNIIAVFPQAEDQLNKAKTQQGLQNIIDASHIALLNKYYSGINTASGGTTADGQPVSIQSQVPVTNTATQPAPHVDIKNWGMQLPPIQ